MSEFPATRAARAFYWYDNVTCRFTLPDAYARCARGARKGLNRNGQSNCARPATGARLGVLSDANLLV